MPLPWVRLDTSIADNPKVLRLIGSHREGMAAAFVWVCSITYSGKHGTDGFIERVALARVNGKAIHARLLVDHQFWKDEGIGWSIHDYAEYQESTEDTQRRSQRAREAALIRWHGDVHRRDER